MKRNGRRKNDHVRSEVREKTRVKVRQARTKEKRGKGQRAEQRQNVPEIANAIYRQILFIQTPFLSPLATPLPHHHHHHHLPLQHIIPKLIQINIHSILIR